MVTFLPRFWGSRGGFLASATPEHFDKTFNINARGAFFTAQKALPLLNNGGSIILVASCVHLKGIPQYAVYSATKAALRSFARSWAASRTTGDHAGHSANSETTAKTGQAGEPRRPKDSLVTVLRNYPTLAMTAHQ